VPFGHWTRVKVLGAIGTQGMVAAMSVEAATTAAVFHAYLDPALARPDTARRFCNASLEAVSSLPRCVYRLVYAPKPAHSLPPLFLAEVQ
jgi:hypothetical protein